MSRPVSKKPRVSRLPAPRKPSAPRKDKAPVVESAAGRASLARTRRGDVERGTEGTALERRRASRFLWAACESLLAAEPRAVNRSLDMLQRAFECDGVALHALGASGAIEPWSARGAWNTRAGDLRDCMSVPLFRSSERVGTLELLAPRGRSWRPTQLSLIRTAASALGAALGARTELQRLRQQPGRDSLTGLPDRGGFHTRLDEELARARRSGMTLPSVVVIDVDHLAAVNEKYGRPAGDSLLSELALVLRLVLRESDGVARLQGGTFGLVLPETDRESALRCAERVRRALEDHRFPRAGRVTVSCGIAAPPADGPGSAELLQSAEKSLSLAKKGARRRVAAPARRAAH